MERILQWSKLLRVKQYIKNFLVLVPLFFSRKLTSENISAAILGTIVFCFISSVVYIVNDLSDIENDKQHPVKCKRPLASGKIAPKSAATAAAIIAISGFAIAYFLNKVGIIILLFYLMLNIAYSKGLKNVAILDVCILAFGYLLRIFYGAILVKVPISNLLYLTVLAAAFFLGFGKRRGEMQKIESSSTTRKVLEFYTPEFLNHNMYLAMTLTIVFYSMWCINSVPFVDNIIWSVPMVIIIFMRYSLIVEGVSDGDPVNVFLSDKPLILLSAVYICYITAIFYFV